MKKILFIAPQPFFQWRGSPIRVGFNVQALAELGYDVDLLTLPIGEEKQISGVRIFRVANPLDVRNIPIGPSAHKAFFDILIFFKAIPMAIRNKYAVIHAVEETAVIAWVASWFCGAKVIFEKHSDPASHKDRFFKNIVLAVYRWVEHFAIRRADAVIATGPGLVEQARRVAPHKTIHHIFDIPSSLIEPDAQKTSALHAELQKRGDEVLILYVGSFAVYQGIDLMFDSMPEVLAKNAAARFVIIGGTEEEIATRKAWLAQRGLEDRVTFVGRVPPDDLPNYLAAADVLLSPRLSGINTPLKLLDYLKAGRAIVATDNSANRQILDEQCAALVKAEPAEFAAGILRLTVDASERKRLGEKGRKLVEQTYNFTEFKRRLKICYDQLEVGSP